MWMRNMMVCDTLASGGVMLSQDRGPGLWTPGRAHLAMLCLGVTRVEYKTELPQLFQVKADKT